MRLFQDMIKAAGADARYFCTEFDDLTPSTSVVSRLRNIQMSRDISVFLQHPNRHSSTKDYCKEGSLPRYGALPVLLALPVFCSPCHPMASVLPVVYTVPVLPRILHVSQSLWNSHGPCRPCNPCPSVLHVILVVRNTTLGF